MVTAPDQLVVVWGRRDEMAVDDGVLGAGHRFRMERDTLRSRLDIKRGDYLTAFKRLKKTFRLASSQRSPRTWSALLWKIQLNSERLAMTVP